MKAVCLWSGPRNVSTALMYSFAQRPDTKVVDEPLYGHFLRVTGTVHPGRDEVMANVNCDGDEVMRELLTPSPDNPDVLFMKQMAHHLVEIDQQLLLVRQFDFDVDESVFTHTCLLSKQYRAPGRPPTIGPWH